MKLNKILMALAATAIVGCTSEDVNDFTAKQAPEDSRLVELNSNFVLAGVGVDGDFTRTHWEQDATTKALKNKFLPIYKVAATGLQLDAAVDDYKLKQAVGLCWLGQTPGAEVYTNYQFYHFGWLNNGETEANIECDKLTNGSLYSDIGNTTDATLGVTANLVAGAANAEAVPGTDWTVAAIPTKSQKAGADNLNYNSGVYKTDNKAIFGGQYIVYYPFNENFKEAGTIPAKAETVFNKVSTNFNTPELGNATFRYSGPVTIEGGAQAGGFGLYNLSSLVQLRVATPTTDATLAGVETIDQIVLYSAKEQLLKQANLAADKIVAGQKGAGLYASTEGTKTIVANFGAAVTLQKTNSTTPAPTSAYITVLPTKVEDLVVLVHSASLKKWARIDKANTEFEAGKAKRLDVTVTAADFKADYIAVDEASLTTALNDARTVASATVRPTITVIGDITLGTVGALPYSYNINNTKDVFITIAGDDIIVPEDVTLNLATNMASDVRVLGKSCCTGTLGGRLNIQGGNVSNVTMEPSDAKVTPATYDNYNPLVTYAGNAVVRAGKTFDAQAGNVQVDAAVEQREGNIKIAEGVKVTVSATGNLSFLGTTVDNYGTIEVMKAGEFYMKNANGTSVWSDGQKMTNHATGKFIHNVDAVVGTAVQFMNQETGSEYRCRVDKQKALDDAYVQWTACSVIEMVNSSAAITYNLGSAVQHTIWGSPKHVDIEVNNIDKTTSTIYKTTFQKSDDKSNIQIGNLTVLTPLDVNDNKTAADKPQRTLTVNGNMTVSANTTLINSKKITVTGNLDIDNAATLVYAGANAIVEGLKVGGNITVTDAANFNASANGGILISCTNFSLSAGATATFGNRTAGDSANKTLEVKGTISNGKGCTFTISPATLGNLLAWITCYKTEGEGTYAGTPTVVKP